MDSLKKIVGRIEARLEARKLSASKASTMAGLSADAIRNMKRGARGDIKTKSANATTFSALARVLKTSPDWLMTGRGPEEPHRGHIDSEAILSDGPPPKSGVRLVGYVGAGSEAHYYALSQSDFEEVEAPPGANDQTVAVEIKGKSLGAMFDRWLVYYDDVRSPIDDSMIGELCVVGLADDRILVKQVARERDGSFTLHSNSSSEAPILDVDIEWAALVTGLKRR